MIQKYPELMQENKSIEVYKESPKFYEHTLQHGHYDINYVIKLLRVIEEKCHQYRMSPNDLRFSLQQSCQKLINFLEIERDNSL